MDEWMRLNIFVIKLTGSVAKFGHHRLGVSLRKTRSGTTKAWFGTWSEYVQNYLNCIFVDKKYSSSILAYRKFPYYIPTPMRLLFALRPHHSGGRLLRQHWTTTTASTRATFDFTRAPQSQATAVVADTETVSLPMNTSIQDVTRGKCWWGTGSRNPNQTGFGWAGSSGNGKCN